MELSQKLELFLDKKEVSAIIEEWAKRGGGASVKVPDEFRNLAARSVRGASVDFHMTNEEDLGGATVSVTINQEVPDEPEEKEEKK